MTSDNMPTPKKISIDLTSSLLIGNAQRMEFGLHGFVLPTNGLYPDCREMKKAQPKMAALLMG